MLRLMQSGTGFPMSSVVLDEYASNAILKEYSKMRAVSLAAFPGQLPDLSFSSSSHSLFGKLGFFYAESRRNFAECLLANKRRALKKGNFFVLNPLNDHIGPVQSLIKLQNSSFTNTINVNIISSNPTVWSRNRNFFVERYRWHRNFQMYLLSINVNPIGRRYPNSIVYFFWNLFQVKLLLHEFSAFELQPNSRKTSKPPPDNKRATAIYYAYAEREKELKEQKQRREREGRGTRGSSRESRTDEYSCRTPDAESAYVHAMAATQNWPGSTANSSPKILASLGRKNFRLKFEIINPDWQKIDKISVAFPNENFYFFNRTLRIGVCISIYMHGKRLKSGRLARAHGFYAEIIKYLAKRLHFKYELVLAKDRKYGSRRKNSTSWTGLIGMTQRNEVDFTAAEITVTDDRMQAVDFSYPVIEESNVVLMARYNRTKSLFEAFHTFQYYVWFTCLGCVLLVAGILAIFLAITKCLQADRRRQRERRQHQQTDDMRTAADYSQIDHDHDHDHNHFRISDGDDDDRKMRKPHGFLHKLHQLLYSQSHTLDAIGSFTMQGQYMMPSNSSSRILLPFWWIFIVCIMAAYSGNLVANLSRMHLNVPFKSLDGLANQSQVRILQYKGSSRYTMLQHAKPSSTYGRMFRLMADDVMEARRRTPRKRQKSLNSYVKTGKFVRIVSKTYAIYRTGKNCDSLQFLPHEFQRGMIAFPFNKNSDFIQVFNNEIRSLVQNGIIQHIFKGAFYGNICRTSIGQQTTLSLVDVGGVFLVLIVATAASMILLFLEICLHKIFN